MAFKTNPSQGEYHNENWRDFYADQRKYHAMYSPVVTHITNHGDSNNHPNVTINRHALNRYARRMIKIHCGFITNGAHDVIGLGITRQLSWIDFSNPATYNSASGVTNWGNGGGEYTNWEKSKAFTYQFWLHDQFDVNRGTKANFYAMLDVTMVQHEPNGIMMTWQCQHHCAGDVPIWTNGKAVITAPINEITAVDLRSANGVYVSGRMTVEYY